MSRETMVAILGPQGEALEVKDNQESQEGHMEVFHLWVLRRMNEELKLWILNFLIDWFWLRYLII